MKSLINYNIIDNTINYSRELFTNLSPDRTSNSFMSILPSLISTYKSLIREPTRTKCEFTHFWNVFFWTLSRSSVTQIQLAIMKTNRLKNENEIYMGKREIVYSAIDIYRAWRISSIKRRRKVSVKPCHQVYRNECKAWMSKICNWSTITNKYWSVILKIAFRTGIWKPICVCTIWTKSVCENFQENKWKKKQKFTYL